MGHSKAQGCHLKVDRDAYRSPTGYGRTCCQWCGGHSVRPPFAGSPQVWRGLLVGEAARDRQDQLCHTGCRVEPRAGVRSPAAPSPVDHRVHCLPQRPATIAVNLIRRQAPRPPHVQRRGASYRKGPRNITAGVQYCRGEAFGKVIRRSELGSRLRTDSGARSRRYLRPR